MQPVVETINLTKAYNGTKVVDDLNLKIECQIFGFLGPNGAGKTTTILMLLGLTEPTSGIASVGGFNSTREPLKVKRISGYVPEKVGFYEDLSAAQNLAYTARLNGIPEDKVTSIVGESLEIVGLKNKLDQPVGTFSKGMKQRLAIGDILVKTPQVAFLDEPTSGIDPEGVNQMLDLIARIAKERCMTIIMSSHQLHQVERICQRVGIMSKGKLVVEGPLDQLSKKAGGGRVNIELQLSEITSEIVEALKRLNGVVSVERSGDLLLVSATGDLRRQVSKVIQEKEGLVIQMKLQSYALEDIYMKYFKEG